MELVARLMILRVFTVALFPTGFAVLVSFAIGRWGFNNMYYMAQLLPAFMMFYVLLAWLIYLRNTSFLGWNRSSMKPREVLGHHEYEMARSLPQDKVSGKEMRYLRDEKGLIFRVSEKDGEEPGQDVSEPSLLSNAAVVLLCSALQLAVLSSVLYKWFGIGARFF